MIDEVRNRLERAPTILLGGACLAVLAYILVAGLWPFHAPANSVAWLKGEDGLRFTYPSAILSDGEILPAGSNETSCSIEAWLEPALTQDSSTILAFYTPENSAQLAVKQSVSDLLITAGRGRGWNQARTGALYVDDLFRATRPMFLTITIGARGLSVYRDGLLLRSAPRFPRRENLCAGRLVVGSSSVTNAGWTGTVRGLAVYHRELGTAQVLRHFEAWRRNGSLELLADTGEWCSALYRFDERGGNRVHNRAEGRADLVVPERYEVPAQTFLEPFWKQTEFKWGYWSDILLNICGLVPLGFFWYGYLRRVRRGNHLVVVTIALGALVSIMIEVLQVFLPTRDSDTTDILTNTLGTAIGVVLYRYLIERRPKSA